MHSKVNTKLKIVNPPSNFFIGDVKGEIKKVKSLWNRVQRVPISSNQVDNILAGKICGPIPPNQAQLVAEARGEKQERSYFNSVYMVKVI